MSPEVITVGGVAETSEPQSTPYDDEFGGVLSIHYRTNKSEPTFTVETSLRPPDGLLLSVELAFEGEAVYMRAVEVDISTEGETPDEALESLVGSVREWLEFLHEERPDLAPDLEPQRRYTRLLRYSPSTWFGLARVK